MTTRLVRWLGFSLVVACQAQMARPLPTLELDARYAHEIEFDVIGLVVPLRAGQYLRNDGAVQDVFAHTDVILDEVGIKNASLKLSNPARFGRQMRLQFAAGESCSFIWIIASGDERAELARLQHEKYHALCALQPAAVEQLSRRVQELGFELDFGAHDEEFGARLVEVLSLHLNGARLEFIIGASDTKDAVDAIRASKRE
jgi:hypothetical protein